MKEACLGEWVGSGEAVIQFSFLKGSILKEKNLLPKKVFCPLRVDLILEGP